MTSTESDNWRPLPLFQIDSPAFRELCRKLKYPQIEKYQPGLRFIAPKSGAKTLFFNFGWWSAAIGRNGGHAMRA